MHEFTWFHLIPAVSSGFPFLKDGAASWLIPVSWLVCIVIVTLAIFARLGLEKARKKEKSVRYSPDDRLTARNFMELYIEALMDLMTTVLGAKDARKFFPVLGSLFLYILVSNLTGLLPGFLPPTSNFSNNLGLGLLVFILFNAVGLWRNGFNYIKHLWGPVLLLGPFFLVIELISLCIRPLSLSLRLTGNLFGDHMVFSVMSHLVPPILPIPFLGLGMFVSFIQALVFTLLSSVYIALAASHESES